MTSVSNGSTERVPVLVLVGADKGGVGKTTVARALADYLGALNPRLIDTQVPAGDLRGFYPQAEVLDLATTTAQMRVFDQPVPLTIVDVSAGLLGRTIAVLDRVGIINDVRAGAVRLMLLYLLGPSVASLSEVVEAHRNISGKVDVFFVKNHINASDYYGWEKDPRFGEALAAMQPRMIDVPQLDETAAESVQQRGQPLASFRPTSLIPAFCGAMSLTGSRGFALNSTASTSAKRCNSIEGKWTWLIHRTGRANQKKPSRSRKSATWQLSRRSPNCVPSILRR
jgi:hypothetical protein